MGNKLFRSSNIEHLEDIYRIYQQNKIGKNGDCLKKYKAILFDLDGTLADTAPGIRGCYRHALNALGKPPPTDDQFANVIGAPPLEIFKKRFNLNEQMAKHALDIYRARYAKIGIKETKIYNGIPQLLNQLKKNGYFLGVATLKSNLFAKSMLINMGIADYFDVVKGMDSNDQLTKAAILEYCISILNILPKDSLLIGDSYYDSEGAKLSGMDFAAVIWGYGFTSEADTVKYNPIFIAKAPEEIHNFLC